MAERQDECGHLRIGELSRRVGVSPDVLRAWERRYKLFTPARSAGGFRLYGDEDERRAARMLAYLDAGISAAQAADLTRRPDHDAAPDRRAASPPVAALAAHLRTALEEFDEETTQSVFDQLLASVSVNTVLRDVVLEYLRALGERWERGETSIAHEHYASALLRGRLLGLARNWGSGSGPVAVLACTAGDQHDLPLICFGIALRGHGWRITFLGCDTPLHTVAQMAELLQPAAVMVSTTLADQAIGVESGLKEVARHAPLMLAGRGATAQTASAVGARYIDQDPVTAAALIAATG